MIIPHAVYGEAQPLNITCEDYSAEQLANAVWLPGLFDMHVKIGQRGKTNRQVMKSASEAARQGGVRGMLVLPTPTLCFDNVAQIDSFFDGTALYADADVDMLPAGTISKDLEGKQQAPYDTLKGRGVRIISDAERLPSSMLMLHRVMKYVAETGLIIALRGDIPSLTEGCCVTPSTTSYNLGLHGAPCCAEEIGTEIIIRLARDAGATLHIQTVSTAESVEIIRRAKAAGQPITAEVALHHLLYTHEDIGDYDTSFKTVPPLRHRHDCDALLAGVKDGTIDCIVSDHTPCTPFDKKQDFPTAPQGMIMLDTFLPLLYTKLVKTGKLSWEELIRACCTNPARIATGSETSGAPVVFLPDGARTITPELLPSATLNSPVLGATLEGCVIDCSFLRH